MLLSTQGPFPPPALPGFSGTTDPSATLTARPAPRGVPVDVCRIPVRASRVAAFFPFHACQRHYPDGSGSVPASLSSPSANGLPLKSGGSASVLSVSRPARRSLAFRPAWSLSHPWRPLTPECFRPYRCLHDPPWLLPTGATVVGRGSHPPEEDAFPRRTGPSWITLFSFVSAKAIEALPTQRCLPFEHRPLSFHPLLVARPRDSNPHPGNNPGPDRSQTPRPAHPER